MSFVAAYIFSLFAPGFLISRLLKITDQLFLHSLSLSLSYFVLNLSICIYLKTSSDAFLWVYMTGLVLLFAFFLLSSKPPLKVNWAFTSGCIILLLISGIYFSLVGIYDELPSDFFKHLEFFKEVKYQIETGNFASVSDSKLLSKSVKYWYHLPIMTGMVSHTDFFTQLPIFSALNGILILCGVYWYAIWLFQYSNINTWQLVLTGFLSAFFFAAHFGINAFSYIRYYAIAPTILNYLVYLSATIVLINFYQHKISLIKFCFLIVIFFLTTFVLHAQEAMFIGTIFFLISTVLFAKQLGLHAGFFQQANHDSKIRSVLIIFPVLLVIALSFYFYSVTTLTPGHIIKPKLVSLNDLIGQGSSYFVLNPYFQFYTVVTHWGLFVAMAYMFYYRQFFINQPVLLAGMLVPLVTVFNPLFVNLFLHYSSSIVLWRFLYMLPLSFIAARLVSGLVFNHEKYFVLIPIKIVAICLIFILLLPIKLSMINLPYSRIYSLTKVHHQARPSYWVDMLNYLNTLPESEQIITDPVTGYMISALTRHSNRRYKFYIRWIKDPYNFDDYIDHPLKSYKNKLFIVNLRKGMSTQTAKIAKHWNADTLKLTEYYNQKLLDHINSEPSHFKLLWQADAIQIYRIIY